MSMFDCPRCSELLCECGYSYRAYRVDYLEKIRDKLNEVIEVRRKGWTWCASCDQPMPVNPGTNLCGACVERMRSDASSDRKEDHRVE